MISEIRREPGMPTPNGCLTYTSPDDLNEALQRLEADMRDCALPKRVEWIVPPLAEGCAEWRASIAWRAAE